MDFWDRVLNSIGKGGPNLLVPLGLFVFIRIQYSVLLWLWWISILFWALCMHEIMVVLRALLWWIHALLPSAKPLGFTSSLGSKFLSISRFEKTPFLLGFSSIPLKPWSESSIPLVGRFTRSLWSCLQILVSFGLVLGLQLTRFPKNTGWKNSALLGQDFSLLPVE